MPPLDSTWDTTRQEPLLGTDQHWNKCRHWPGRYHHWRLHWHGVLFWWILFPFKECWWQVWHRHGERYQNDCLVQTDRWGGGSVMVWGGISYHHWTALHVLWQNECHLLPGQHLAKSHHSLLSSAMGYAHISATQCLSTHIQHSI